MNGSPSTSSHPDVEDCLLQCHATLKFSSRPTDYNLKRTNNFKLLDENLSYLEMRFDKIAKEKKVELKLKAKLADLTEKLKKQEQVNKKLELTVHESNNKNQELHTEVQTLTSRLEDEKESNQELQGAISDLEDKNERIQKNLEDTSNQLHVEKQSNQELQTTTNELENKLVELQRHVETITRQLVQEKQSNQALTRRNNELENKVKEVQENSRRITSQFEHTQKSLEEQLKKNALELNNLKTESQRNLSETTRSLQESLLKLQKMTADRDALDEAINRQNEVIMQNENNLKDLVEENEQLLTQKETLENKISKLSVLIADGVLTDDFIDMLTKMKSIIGNSLEEEKSDCKDEISSILERLTFLVQCVQEWGSEIDRISLFSMKVRNIAASPLTLCICSVLFSMFAVLFLYNERNLL